MRDALGTSDDLRGLGEDIHNDPTCPTTVRRQTAPQVHSLPAWDRAKTLHHSKPDLAQALNRGGHRLPALDRADALGRARKDHVARLDFEVARQVGDLLGYGPDHVREIARLFRDSVNAERDFPAGGMADLCSRVNGADGTRRIGRLAQFPWAAQLLGLVLEVAPGHIEADAVSIDMIERRLDRNVA